MREQFSRVGLPHASICFEITETDAIKNLDKAMHLIHELRALGCKFSLDDFGTGMSSFFYLKHLPVDFLKIDGSFVKDMLDDPIDRAMVEAINNIGHVMRKQTIAEFVESEQTLASLRDIGVDFAQGYGIAKPKPFDFLAPVDPAASDGFKADLAGIAHEDARGLTDIACTGPCGRCGSGYAVLRGATRALTSFGIRVCLKSRTKRPNHVLKI